jgi:hypothetical protein
MSDLRLNFAGIKRNDMWGINTDRSPIVNVFPLDDEQKHNLDDPFLCWCEPKQEDNLYIHHSADCREAVELAEEFLNKLTSPHSKGI